MLVTRVTGPCYKCGEPFGNVSISDNRLLRGCSAHCGHQETYWLPEVRKKVIYLDQFFLSLAFRQKNPKIVAAAEKLKRLAAMQLVVMPYSSVHEDETALDRDNKTLLDFIKKTARGHEFYSTMRIQERQVQKAFYAFLDDKPAKYHLEDRDAFRRDTLNRWDNYFFVDVNIRTDDVDRLRKNKAGTAAALAEAIPQWAALKNTFEQDVEIEFEESGRQYLKAHVETVDRFIAGDFMALIAGSHYSQTMQILLHDYKDKREGVRAVMRFFESQHFRRVPSLQLFARLFAAFKHHVRAGAFKNLENADKRLTGHMQDVEFISAYAPYCDALFTDRQMASLLQQDRRVGIGAGRDYPCRVFSVNNSDEFMTWLDEIEESASEEHLNAVQLAYPMLGTSQS